MHDEPSTVIDNTGDTINDVILSQLIHLYPTAIILASLSVNKVF